MMSKLRPDPEQLADAKRRAAFAAEHVPDRSNVEGERVLAFDTLADFNADIFEGPRSQVAWALLWAEARERLIADGDVDERPLEPHERRLIEDAWKKIHEDAEQQEWEQLGLQGGSA
jgi:hypothetical protein